MEAKKNFSKNLENKKSLFFQIGLVIALVNVLCAFQWKFHERVIFKPDQGIVIHHDVEMIEITIPEPPKPPPINELTEIITTPNDDLSDDFDFKVDIDANATTIVQDFVITYMPSEEPVEDPIFSTAEVMPEFPGGVQALYRYLGQNLNYPAQEREAGVQGTVFIGFVVEKDGSITHVHVQRSVSNGLDTEALRVIRNMPDWLPGRMGVNPVRFSYTLPVSFRLQK